MPPADNDCSLWSVASILIQRAEISLVLLTIFNTFWECFITMQSARACWENLIQEAEMYHSWNMTPIAKSGTDHRSPQLLLESLCVIHHPFYVKTEKTFHFQWLWVLAVVASAVNHLLVFHSRYPNTIKFSEVFSLPSMILDYSPAGTHIHTTHTYKLTLTA